MKKSVVFLVIVTIICIVAYQKLTFFVIQPIGSIPEGKTVVISRQGKLNFVDSADALCERIQGGVSLLCRAAALAGVAKQTTIYLRLPYSEWLYLLSTDGKVYEK